VIGRAAGLGPRKGPDLEGEIALIASEVLGVDPPSPDRDLGEAGVDSIAFLELLAELERRFDIELPEDLLPDLRSVTGIARVVADAMASGGATEARQSRS